jgi:hypothetical protein
MSYIISGIQQLGVGNTNVQATFAWYRKAFGTDIKIFEEAAMAELMLPYTDQKPHARHAILALSINGGGGFEIWQYTSRVAQKADFTIQLGDIGIFAGKIKSFDIQASYNHLKQFGATILTEITLSPDDRKHFYIHDLWGNTYEVIEKWSLPVINPEGFAFDKKGNLLVTCDDMQRIYYFNNPNL